MLKIRAVLSGRESVFRSNVHRLLNGLAVLTLFRDAPARITSWEQLKAAVDRYDVFYDSSLNGDRVQSLSRKKARAEVTQMIQQITRYLESIAGEDDIPALIQAGFEVRMHTSLRKKKIAAPAT